MYIPHVRSILGAMISLVIGLLLGSIYYYHSPFYKAVTHAIAVIHPTKGNSVAGKVVFSKQHDGMHIQAFLSGLTPGEHGIHIHELGDCGCDDAKCAGEHFNPTNEPHAGPHDMKRHVGDLGNVIADAHGDAVYTYVDTVITLNGPHSIIGRTVIIHADKDDCASQPSGNSGTRIGCGVVGLARK